jgi:hypothetical protein
MTCDCPAWVSLHRRYRHPASKLGIARIGRVIVSLPRSGQTWRFRSMPLLACPDPGTEFSFVCDPNAIRAPADTYLGTDFSLQ